MPRRRVVSVRLAILLILALPVLAALALSTGCYQSGDRTESMRTLARWQDSRLADSDSLAALMTDPDAHLRRAAMRTAGMIGRDEALPGLLAGLDDRSDAVRGAAAIALGRLGDPAAVDPMIEAMASGHTTVRRAVLEALAMLPNDGQALIDPALHGEEPDAILAWNALRDRAADIDPPLLSATIRAGLVRKEPDVLWRVLRCAERSADSTLAADIAPFTLDRHVQARVHACRALGRIGGPDALAAVLECGEDRGRISRCDLARLRINAARALGALAGPALAAADPDAGPGSVPGRIVSLLTAWSHSTDPAVALTALQAISSSVSELPAPPESSRRESLLPVWRIRLLRAVRTLIAESPSDSAGAESAPIPGPANRAAAATALCALRGAGTLADSAWPAVESDPDPQVEAAVWRALGRYVLDTRGLIMRSMSLDPELPAPVAAAAIEGMVAALDRLQKADAEQTAESIRARNAVQRALVAAADSDDYVLAATAAGLLGGMRNPAALVSICRAFESAAGEGAPDIRLAALDGIRRIFTPPADEPAIAIGDSLRRRVVACLEESFDSPDIRQRLQARTAAVESGLLPPNLIPGEASLKATMKAVVRCPDQAPPALPFRAPRLICSTDRGDFAIALDGEAAPNFVTALLALVADGFYDGMTFHRVVPDFVIQGGDPRGDGWGGPDFTLRSEWSRIPYDRGVVGIAHSGKDTGGSQFFVTLSPQPHLNGRYTVIGKVVSGMEVADAVQQGDTFRLTVEPE